MLQTWCVRYSKPHFASVFLCPVIIFPVVTKVSSNQQVKQNHHQSTWTDAEATTRFVSCSWNRAAAIRLQDPCTIPLAILTVLPMYSSCNNSSKLHPFQCQSRDRAMLVQYFTDVDTACTCHEPLNVGKAHSLHKQRTCFFACHERIMRSPRTFCTNSFAFHVRT